MSVIFMFQNDIKTFSKPKFIAISAVIFLIIGILVGFFSEKIWKNTYATSERGSIVRQGGYKFINPILSCEIGNQDTFKELKPIEQNVKIVVNKNLDDKSAENISVYFRLMNSGRWFGVNEDTTYAPASLLKVIAMLGYYYKLAESEPNVLSQNFVYTGNLSGTGSDTETSVKEKLINGQKYSVETLIKTMITKSSNQALNTLLGAVHGTELDALNRELKEISTDLNIPFESTMNETEMDIMSPKTYSMVFRVLYSSTYLNRTGSENALDLLTKTDFKDGLVAELPEGLQVAHKFGVKTIQSTAGGNLVKELHDCGIVYFPDHPYLICIMTRGSDYLSLEETIAEISKTTYDSVKTFFENDKSEEIKI
jgi:beta-lactamase class A